MRYGILSQCKLCLGYGLWLCEHCYYVELQLVITRLVGWPTLIQIRYYIKILKAYKLPTTEFKLLSKKVRNHDHAVSYQVHAPPARQEQRMNLVIKSEYIVLRFSKKKLRMFDTLYSPDHTACEIARPAR